jgi:hypothetical protein
MSCPLIPGDAPLQSAAKMSAALHRVTLADVLADVHVAHELAKSGETRVRLYHIRFNLINPAEYKQVRSIWC